ncbi:hypothetical protein M3598_14730 [Cytobacillus oceanisediminis]|uniref:hypothetical protein n=1 Tax=Cytobacillus oceanisediminis TaxID=665099 RepID=UPI00203A8124|nr:hypothetical protein [Cytobacillus oceanisediminis]MCM3244005.1 hypothetical protein [Cytobacillus oceanisediminis]
MSPKLIIIQTEEGVIRRYESEVSNHSDRKSENRRYESEVGPYPDRKNGNSEV